MSYWKWFVPYLMASPVLISLPFSSDSLSSHSKISSLPSFNCSLAVEAIILPDACDQGIGQITLDIRSGTPPYSIQWSTGQSDELSIANLSAGEYATTITDSNGCTHQKSVRISNALADLSALSVVGDTICGNSLPIITLVGLPKDTFTEHLIDGNSSQPADLDAADIDLDGDIDVAAISSSDIYWYENLGNDNYTRHPLPTTALKTEQIFTLDLDLDGDLDLLTTESFFPNTSGIYWFENDGNQQFTEQHIPVLSDKPLEDLWPVDMNQDGLVDLFASDPGYIDTMLWYQNNGAGQFSEKIAVMGSASIRKVAYPDDIDGDGKVDIVAVTDGSEPKLVWYQNDGAGNFIERVIEEVSILTPHIITEDINQDGETDILIVYHNNSGLLQWYENTGDGSFIPHTIDESLSRANFIEIVDLEGDGDIDILSGAADLEERIYWYENNGFQQFSKRTITSGLDRPVSISIADADLDGDLDVFGAGRINKKIAWYEQPSDGLLEPISVRYRVDNGPMQEINDLTSTADSITFSIDPQAPGSHLITIEEIIDAYGCPYSLGIETSIVVNPPDCTDCSSTDSLALIQFFNSTDGPNWSQPWDTSQPYRSWPGIVTNEEGCVLTINLVNNQLAGTIPATLSNFSKLEVINLDSNSLQGNIPTNLAEINTLLFLSLDFNELSGNIPPELGEFENLEILEIAGNNLSGDIPPELGQLATLKFLSLFSNQLENEIPPDLGLLTNLEYLSLFNNNLVGKIPEALANCGKLKELYLDENDLSGTIPEAFSALTDIEIFRVGGNRLDEKIPDFTSSWPKIRQFYFLNNQFTFEDFIHFVDGITGQIAANRQVAFDQLYYAPQDSIFRDTLISRAAGDNLTVDLGIDTDILSNEYIWYKNGVYYETVIGENKLTFLDLALDDTGEYYCEVVNSNASELVLFSRPFTLEVDNSPLSFSFQIDHVTCPNGVDGQVTFQITGGMAPYEISLAGGQIFELSAENMAISNLAFGSYDFTLSDSLGNAIEGSFTINQPDAFAIEEIVYQHDTLGGLCTGLISIELAGGTPPYTINWSDGAEGMFRTALCEGLYVPTVQDELGCQEMLSAIEISRFGIYAEEITSPTCSNDNFGRISLDLQGGDQPYQFYWEDEMGMNIPGNEELNNLQSGKYFLTVSEGSGNEIIRTYVIDSNEEDLVPKAKDDVFLTPAGATVFPLLISLNDSLLFNRNYFVEVISSPPSVQLEVKNDTIFYFPEKETKTDIEINYRICDTACASLCDEASVLISHQEGPSFFVPDALSPNGDGFNDIFVIPEIRDNPEKYPQRELTIVNRWGHVIFQAKPYNNDWDGRSKTGHLLPAGTYFYIIRLDIGEGEIKQGSILIVR